MGAVSFGLGAHGWKVQFYKPWGHNSIHRLALSKVKAIGHPGHPPFTKLHRQKINALDGVGEVNLMFFRLNSAASSLAMSLRQCPILQIITVLRMFIG